MTEPASRTRTIADVVFGKRSLQWGVVRLALLLMGVLFLGLCSLLGGHCDGRWCVGALVVDVGRCDVEFAQASFHKDFCVVP